jgi:hypothetical protein
MPFILTAEISEGAEKIFLIFLLCALVLCGDILAEQRVKCKPILST